MGCTVSNRGRERGIGVGMRQQSRKDRRKTNLSLQFRNIWLQSSYPSQWPRPTHIWESYSRTHPLRLLGSLIHPLWPKHPSALHLGPIRSSFRRARHRRLQLLMRHGGLDLGPDMYADDSVCECSYCCHIGLVAIGCCDVKNTTNDWWLAYYSC